MSIRFKQSDVGQIIKVGESYLEVNVITLEPQITATNMKTGETKQYLASELKDAVRLIEQKPRKSKVKVGPPKKGRPVGSKNRSKAVVEEHGELIIEQVDEKTGTPAKIRYKGIAGEGSRLQIAAQNLLKRLGLDADKSESWPFNDEGKGYILSILHPQNPKDKANEGLS